MTYSVPLQSQADIFLQTRVFQFYILLFHKGTIFKKITSHKQSIIYWFDLLIGKKTIESLYISNKLLKHHWYNVFPIN